MWTELSVNYQTMGTTISADQDDVLEPPVEVPAEEEDASELHDNFVQMMAGGGGLGESSTYA